jgi:hypothetical protein
MARWINHAFGLMQHLWFDLKIRMCFLLQVAVSCGDVGLLQVVCLDALLAAEFIWLMA